MVAGHDLLLKGIIDLAPNPFNTTLNELGEGKLCFDGDAGAGDFSVTTFFAISGAERYGFSETTVCWRVITKYIKRAFTSVEARTACLNLAFVLVGFADFELIAAALQIFVESFVSYDLFFLHSLTLSNKKGRQMAAYWLQVIVIKLPNMGSEKSLIERPRINITVLKPQTALIKLTDCDVANCYAVSDAIIF
uniref:hypothetical protein n=1 Tax=Klebsiella michiganensis TaxID=1134687 RepID=UPI001E48FF08|nr:hypothetical protein [Klebsiella michiganensis]